jgi:hypothetical protein
MKRVKTLHVIEPLDPETFVGINSTSPVTWLSALLIVALALIKEG